MPIVDYSLYMQSGFEGQLAANLSYTSMRGAFNEAVNSSNAVIPYGRVVVQKPGGTLGDIQLPSATGQVVMGVVYILGMYEKSDTGVAGVPAGRPISYLRKGIIYMVAEVAVTTANQVFFRHTANPSPGLYDAIGRVRNNADTARGDQLVAARFLRNAAAGTLVPVEIDL